LAVSHAKVNDAAMRSTGARRRKDHLLAFIIDGHRAMPSHPEYIPMPSTSLMQSTSNREVTAACMERDRSHAQLCSINRLSA
jgi:hypothetical protein